MEWNGEGSNLTATIDRVDAKFISIFEDKDVLAKRRKIDVVAWASVVAAGGTTILAAKAGIDIYEQIASLIKGKAKHNSCSLAIGTDYDGHKVEGYAYLATTTGHDCKTTAEEGAILTAVKKCADYLHAHAAISGCCQFSHGGTWKGHLRLTSQPSKYPAHVVNC